MSNCDGHIALLRLKDDPPMLYLTHKQTSSKLELLPLLYNTLLVQPYPLPKPHSTHTHTLISTTTSKVPSIPHHHPHLIKSIHTMGPKLDPITMPKNPYKIPGTTFPLTTPPTPAKTSDTTSNPATPETPQKSETTPKILESKSWPTSPASPSLRKPTSSAEGNAAPQSPGTQSGSPMELEFTTPPGNTIARTLPGLGFTTPPGNVTSGTPSGSPDNGRGWPETSDDAERGEKTGDKRRGMTMSIRMDVEVEVEGVD